MRKHLESINFIFVKIFVTVPVENFFKKTKTKKPFLGYLNPKILPELAGSLTPDPVLFVFSNSSICSSYPQKRDFLLPLKTHAFVRWLIKRVFIILNVFSRGKINGFCIYIHPSHRNAAPTLFFLSFQSMPPPKM